MKKRNKDYEQLYYDLLYTNNQLCRKIKNLEEEINILKRNQKNNIKDFIIKEFKRYEKRSKK